MQITKLPRDALLTPLSMVSGIIRARHTLPILSHVLIETESDKLRLTASDLEIQIAAEHPAPGVTAGQAVTVPAKKLQDILRALPSDSVLKLDGDTRLTLQAGRSRHRLQTMPAADFPRVQVKDVLVSITMMQKELKALLGLVAYTMGKRDIRYYLNGALIELEGDKLIAVATDGHRITAATHQLTGRQEKRQIIVPSDTVHVLSKLIDGDDPVTLDILYNQLRARFGSVELVSKLIDGKFPDYDRVLPPKPLRQVQFNREELLDTLKRAAILSRTNNPSARLALDGKGLVVSCRNEDQEESEEGIEFDHAGPAFTGSFIVNYLIEAAANLPTDSIEFGFDGERAFVTMPDRDDFRSVIMGFRD